ncbi:nucleotidyltransferase domain-containing protein [Candidatus Woesearchaeota archaeon]|nr:nucleotidyltransferase domain-containing protein [Candidatus Woesearchaeota archaeon]
MKSLIRRLKGLLKNKQIIDIIIFGSKSRDKMAPGDIDIAVILKEKVNDIKGRISSIIPGADVELVSLEDIYNPLFLVLLKEGFSVRKNDYLHNLYGIRPVKLYKYSLKQLSASKKVMFERGIKSVKGVERLSNSVVVVPIEHTGEFEDFLRQWNLDIDTKEYELMPLLRKDEL